MKTASGAILGSAFFAPGRFFVDFGVQLGSRTGLFGPTFGRLSRLFGQLWANKWFFFVRRCSGRVLGSILVVPGALPGWILRGFWVILCVASVICCTPVLFQLCPKFVRCTPVLCQLSPQVCPNSLCYDPTITTTVTTTTSTRS